MITLKNGGKAFPSSGPVPSYGMSMRQYYATHAPERVPEWFKLEHEELPPNPPSVHGLNEEHKRQVTLVLNDVLDVADADPEVRAFMARSEQAKMEKDAWRNKMREQKFFAWRWHYADMMIRTGAEKP